MQKESAITGRWVEIGWLVLAAGLPLCFAPWGRNIFELPKALMLWMSVALMGAAWLVSRRVAVFSEERYPNLQVVAGLTLAAVVVLALSVRLSMNPQLSAQGSYERMQGAITQLCYLALFLLVILCLREPTQVRRLLAAIAWGSVPVLVYGLFQLMGIDPFDWQVEGVQIISTFGRSNFVGAYLVLAVPPTVVTALQVNTKSWRVAYLLLIGAQVMCLIATRAQAAWLGAMAAGGVLVLAEAWHRGYRRLVRLVIVLGSLALLLGLVVLMKSSGLTGSLGARVTIWQATWSLVKDEPILGYGLETFSQVFTSVFPAELVYLQGRAVLVDRAHNLILDALASVGIVGLLVYGALVGLVLAHGAQRLARSPDWRSRALLAAGLASAIGHLVETQASFQVTGTATLFWLIMGMLVAPWERISPSEEHVPKNELEVPALYRWLAVVLVLVVLPASLLVLGADAHAGQAGHIGTRNELEQSIVSAQRAVALWPTQPIYHQHLSWLYLERARRGNQPVAAFQAAEQSLDRARLLDPADYRVWAGYGELYTEWGLTGDLTRFAQAENAYRQATELFPNSAMLYTGWGLVYVAQNRPAEAESRFHQAVSLDHTDAWAFTYLGDAQLVQGMLAEAEQSYLNAVRWAPKMAAPYQGLGYIYCQRREFDPALEAYQTALSLAAYNPAVYLDMAGCVWESGRPELACQLVQQGLHLEPNHPGLLSALQAMCR